MLYLYPPSLILFNLLYTLLQTIIDLLLDLLIFQLYEKKS
jgi:hypothetical protein